MDAPTVPFFGVGNDTNPDLRFTFAYRSTTVGGGARLQATRWLAVGGSLDVIDNATAASDEGPSFTAVDPTYRRSSLFSEIDTRTSTNYSRRGGLYRVDWADYHQTNAGSSSFQRIDAEVRQFIPLLRENWVIALRAAASTTDVKDGQRVPVFLLPDLGGHDALRGYSSFRFRDRNRLLLSGEYRWTAGPFVDMAVFADAGKVTAHRSDLNLSGLRTSTGIGITLHTLSATIARLEVARTREGHSLIVSFSPSF
jgi:outer membrane protein assembly factor BamA